MCAETNNRASKDRMVHQQRIMESLQTLLGDTGFLRGQAREADAFLHDSTERLHGRTLAVLLPATVEEAQAVVRICYEAGIAMIPQGGNTGRSGGATPEDRDPTVFPSVLLSLRRLNRIRRVETKTGVIEAEAGVTLFQARRAAEAAGFMFPVSLVPETECTLGGMTATNAGGLAALRYGTMRDSLLGLEIIGARGVKMDLMRSLKKDNAGYALRHLFAGSEGTLGLVLAVAVRLVRPPRGRCRAFVAAGSVNAGLDLLASLEATFGDRVSMFEAVASGAFCCGVLEHKDVAPFAYAPAWTFLIELEDRIGDWPSGDSSHAAPQSHRLLDAFLSEQVGKGQVEAYHSSDPLEPNSSESVITFRRAVIAGQKKLGLSFKHDVSLAAEHWQEFVERCGAKLERAFPGIRPVIFGHLGDGNLHYNFSPPKGMSSPEGIRDEVAHIVFDEVIRLRGSVTAEHGVGRFFVENLPRAKDPMELAMMQGIKMLMDPDNLFNPGAVLLEPAG